MKWNEIVAEQEALPNFASGMEHDLLTQAGYTVAVHDIDHVEYRNGDKVIDISNRGIRVPGTPGPITRSLFGTVEKAIDHNNGVKASPDWTSVHGEKMTEGTDYNCPNCDEYLGKASEVIANNNEYCGNCGWSAEEKSSNQNRPDTKPVPAEKPLPKSKQTIVKPSGDFEIRIYPGRTHAGLYYKGKKTSAVSVMDWDGFDSFGSVTKQSDNTWSASRRGRYGQKPVGSFESMAKAANALKNSFKSELKRLTPRK